MTSIGTPVLHLSVRQALALDHVRNVPTSSAVEVRSLPRTWKLSLFFFIVCFFFFYCIFSSSLFCFSCSSPCFLLYYFSFLLFLSPFIFHFYDRSRGRAPTTSSGSGVSMSRDTSGLTSIWCEIRTCRQGCLPRTDVQTTSVRLIFKTLQEQTWRANDGAQGQSARSGKGRTFAGQRTPPWEGQRVPESGPESARWREGQNVP